MGHPLHPCLAPRAREHRPARRSLIRSTPTVWTRT